MDRPLPSRRRKYRAGRLGKTRTRLWDLVAMVGDAHKLSETEKLLVISIMLGTPGELADGRNLRPGTIHFHSVNILQKTACESIAALRNALLRSYFASG